MRTAGGTLSGPRRAGGTSLSTACRQGNSTAHVAFQSCMNAAEQRGRCSARLCAGREETVRNWPPCGTPGCGRQQARIQSGGPRRLGRRMRHAWLWRRRLPWEMSRCSSCLWVLIHSCTKCDAGGPALAKIRDVSWCNFLSPLKVCMKDERQISFASLGFCLHSTNAARCFPAMRHFSARP